MKIKQNKRIFLSFLAVFLISAGFLFFGAENAFAAGKCSGTDPESPGLVISVDSKDACDKLNGKYAEDTTPAKKMCVCSGIPISDDYPTGTQSFPSIIDETACTDQCNTLKAKVEGLKTAKEVSTDKAAAEKTRQKAAQENDGMITTAVKGLLGIILSLVGWFLNVAVLLFAWAVNADSARNILDNSSIFETWGLVRDLCNIGFILILLFSAFSTVFQYSKYNYKSILMWLVIMALLVNFSFPIARFVIDVSNSLMYTILNIEFGAYVEDGGKIFTKSPAFGSLQTIIVPAGNPSITQLLASIIFVFILALTILALAIILLIRIIALAIIIIFSPIGFVGTIIGKDGGWWNHLFQYAMAGPIIALVLLISTRLMAAVGKVSLSGSTYGGDDTDIITGMANFIIPIVILWMGIAMAVKGINGSGAIMGRMQGIARGAGRMVGNGAMGLTGINFARRQFADYARERNTRRDDARLRWGRNIGRNVNQRQDELMARVLPAGMGGDDARDRANRRRQALNREEVTTRATANTENGTDLLNYMNTHSAEALNPTTAGNVKVDHAVRAQALRNMHDTELRRAVEQNLAGTGPEQLTEILLRGEGIFNNVTSIQEHARIQSSLTAIQSGTGTNDNYNTILSYVRTHSGEIQREGVQNGRT